MNFSKMIKLLAEVHSPPFSKSIWPLIVIATGFSTFPPPGVSSVVTSSTSM
jgi:hypothetical protein